MRTQERLRFYESAKAALCAAGFADEMQWQASRSPDHCQPEEFLSEAAWVVINAGFRESIARRLFPALSLCFCDWFATEIVASETGCRTAALSVFAHEGKVDAIIKIARLVDAGWDELKADIAASPTVALEALPHIGPVTAYHLAKNLGYPCAKADRHLKRTALSLGHECVQELCQEIAGATGDPIGLVDLVLWRYAVESKTSRLAA
jgi:hypothetical protein